MSLLRTCTKCSTEWPLRMFPVYGPQGQRRYECRSCISLRTAQYHLERKAGIRPPRQSCAPKAPQPPPNFRLLYSTGTRCWCCRRNSSGQMLCRTCRGAA